MVAVHIVIGSLAILANLLAFLWGAAAWYQRRPSPRFWTLLRIGQGFVILEAVFGGVLIIIGDKASSLHYIYGAVPLFLAVIAEQLKISAAQLTLDKRGIENTQEVATLPQDEQKEIVVTILRREIGVMTLACLVVVILLARAAMVH
jgi:heme A synthase